MSEIEPNAAGPEPEEDEENAPSKRRGEEEARRGPGGGNLESAPRPGSDSEA